MQKQTIKSNFVLHTSEQIDEKLAAITIDAVAWSQYLSPTTKKVYLAGPWFDEKSKKLLKCAEDVLAITKTSAYIPRCSNKFTPQETFDENVKQIKDCDILIAVIDTKDVGTAWEIGMAYALGKRVILVGYDETSFATRTNLMLAFTGKCTTLDKLAEFILDGLFTDQFVNVSNLWEDIE